MSRPESACPGYCCASFYWPRTISWMRKHAHRMVDGAQIRDMLIPLTPKQARERYERFSGKAAPRETFRWKFRGHHFTCRNWDEESRLCKIYETRPQMCRGYPYGKLCEHGCGFAGGTPLKKEAA